MSQPVYAARVDPAPVAWLHFALGAQIWRGFYEKFAVCLSDFNIGSVGTYYFAFVYIHKHREGRGIEYWSAACIRKAKLPSERKSVLFGMPCAGIERDFGADRLQYLD